MEESLNESFSFTIPADQLVGIGDDYSLPIAPEVYKIGPGKKFHCASQVFLAGSIVIAIVC